MRGSVGIMSYPTGFNPLTISWWGWWEANRITGKSDGDSISSFTDSSGNGRHATTSASSGTANPIYKTGIVNGQPVVRFNGTTHGLDFPANMGSSGTGEMFLVFKLDADPPAATQAGHLVQMGGVSGASSRAHLPFTDGNVYETWGTNTRVDNLNVVPSMSSQFRCVHIQSCAPATYKWLIDGTTIDTGVVLTARWNQYGPYLGHADGTTGARWFDGDVALIAMINSTLTSTQRTNVRSYITATYGITF